MPVIKEVQKLWGTELWHHNDESYCMKTLVIRAGAQSSLHYHRLKRETFLVTKGIIVLETGTSGEIAQMHVGDSITLEPGTPHRFAAPFGGEVVEASTMHSDDDVVRLEPSKLL